MNRGGGAYLRIRGWDILKISQRLYEVLRENEIIIHIFTLHTSVKSRSPKRAECASVLTPERLFSPRKRQEFLRFSSFLLSTNSFSLHPRGQTSTPSCSSSFMDMIGFLESTCTFLLTIDHVRDVSLPGLCRKRGLRDQHRSFRSYSHSWNNCQKLWMRTFSYQSTSIGSFTSKVQHLRLFILNPDHEKKLSTMLRKNGYIAIQAFHHHCRSFHLSISLTLPSFQNLLEKSFRDPFTVIIPF